MRSPCAPGSCSPAQRLTSSFPAVSNSRTPSRDYGDTDIEMPPKRSVLCRPPRLLPHSMRLSRQYTDTDRARSRRHTNTD
ncbi:hypothetical protein NDU88_004503 [Pleurodeles waltl]|uniref:Uncharacterized protein n=1 Tax=Pleurodeles waltl TaxID=8319 RepID=A0AAV7VIY0_PLEWA|nr:hypothetical protein NDU88_004503 [Pleurodeles waltl]